MSGDQSAGKSGMTSRELLLLLLGLDGDRISEKGVSGITRLQKLLFLLWKEGGVEAVDRLFEFKAYLKGPYSRKLYDDLEFLENMGLVKSEVAGEASTDEAETIAELSFEQLMGNDANPYVDVPSASEEMTADAFQERKFTLTSEGVQRARELASTEEMDIAKEGIRRIKSKFGTFSLQDLLYHVYTQYDSEGWTSESDIKDKVLGRTKQR